MANEDLGKLRYGIEVDTKGVDKGAEAMDKLQQEADKTGKKVDGASKSIDGMGKESDKTGKKVDGLSKESDKAGRAAKDLGDKSQRAGKQVKDMGDDADKSADSLRTAVTAATALAASLAVITERSANAGKQLQNMARLSGTSVEQFQELAFGANQAGVEADKLGDIYKDVQDKVGDYLATGGGELKDYFENIAPLVGQTAEQFRNLSGPQALQLLSNGLQQAGVSASEMTFYLESIANDASLLTPLLVDNGRGFQEAGKRAQEMGVILSDLQIDQLVEVDKQFNELGTTISRSAQALVADNGPQIVAMLESITEAVSDASKFIKENQDLILNTATILGTATAAMYGYRAAVIATRIATEALNKATKANPLGIIVTVAGAAIGAMSAFADESSYAADEIDRLTRNTKDLSKAERERFISDLQEKAIQKQIEYNEALEREAEIRANTSSSMSGGGLLAGVGTSAELVKAQAESARLKSEFNKIITAIADAKDQQALLNIEINKGVDGGSGGLKEANKELQKLIDKYNPLLAQERELLAEQEELNEALRTAAEKDVPAIEKALDAVSKKLDEINKKRILAPEIGRSGAATGMSIFDMGANTSDDFSDVFVDNLSPKLKNELGVQAKSFGQIFGETLDGLDWSQYGGNIGASLGEALVTGDTSMLKGALSSSLGGITEAAITPALTSAFGAGAASFLGPLGGSIAGTVASGLLSGKQEVSRSIEIVFSEGIAQAFTNIEYESMFGGSSDRIGFSDIENEQLSNSVRNSMRDITRQFDVIGATVEDFAGSFEGDTVSAAIEELTDDYVNAGFSSIEKFQELGEDAVTAFNRVIDDIETLQDGLRGIADRDISDSIKEFISAQGEAIDANQDLTVAYWEAVKVALTDLDTGVSDISQVDRSDAIRSTDLYERAFNTYLADRYQTTSGAYMFGGEQRKSSAEGLIGYIDRNQLAEAISRVGEGVEVATADFSQFLEGAVSTDLASAFDSLANVTASETENLTNQLMNARDDLEALGFDRDISNAEFASLIAAEQVVGLSGDALANFLNAAVILEQIGDLTEQNADLSKEFVDDLMGDVDSAFDVLRRSINAQKEAITESYNDQRDAERDVLDTLNDGLSDLESVANSLKDAIRAAVDESAAVQMQRLQSARAEISRLAASGVIPDSETLNELLNRVTGNTAKFYATAEDYYTSQGITANDLSKLSSLADDQLTEAERQIEIQEDILERLDVQYDADIEALDKQLDYAQQQIDILNGIDTSVLSVGEALNNFASSIMDASVASVAAGGRGISAGGSVITSSSDIVSYTANGGALTWQDIVNDVPRFANGGTHTGGLAMVGEFGPEIVNMPFGAHVSTANQTRNMLDQSELIKSVEALADQNRAMAIDLNNMYNLWRNLTAGNIMYTYNVNGTA